MIRPILLVVVVAPLLGAAPLSVDPPKVAARRPSESTPTRVKPNAPVDVNAPAVVVEPTPPPPALEAKPAVTGGLPLDFKPEDFQGLKSVALIGLISLAPAALLTFTSFVRINIVLILLRQALGSPQVPGNQVLAALALLLSALVMKPVAESVYDQAVRPYTEAKGSMSALQAWELGSKPVKVFMVNQIRRTNHADYLWDMYDYAEPPRPGRVDPVYPEDFPLRAVAPAFLLSELTTALMIGFLIYLPFLVVDLVVSAVLSAMGLFMLPPSLVALPIKLVLFVLANGWLLVATALLRTFAV